jgi:ABC-2 type transport system permease protein
MRALSRYTRLLATQARASLLVDFQYRIDFFLDLVLAAFGTGSALVPLMVLFARRSSVAGWSWAEALIVVAWFNVLKGFLGAVIQPSLQQVVEHIRKGTLDFVLIKPADAQFLVSTARFEFREVADSIAGLVILAYALSKLGRLPSPSAALAALVVLVCAAVILYSIWIMVVALAFVFVKVDNLSFLFLSIYDAARWPASVFRGVFAVIFTFVLPLALMTTFPALAILGRLGGARLMGALGGAVIFFVVSRLVWLRAIRKYTSAGG